MALIGFYEQLNMYRKKISFTEEVLIRHIREKTPKGAQALYDMYSGSLYGVIVRIVSDEAQSEDILQETFTRIWYAFDSYDEKRGRLFTWMVNLARNLAIDTLRSKAYRNNQLNEELDSAQGMTDNRQSPEVLADRHTLKREIGKLRSEEQDVLHLFYYKGYTQVEIAETLRIPLGTVKTRLVMAVRNLRKFCLQQEMA